MRKIFGISLIALGLFLEFLWLGFCFGSIIIGILLLIFAPRVLFFPFNFFLILGIVVMSGKNFKYYRDFQRQNFNNRYRSHSYGSGGFETVTSTDKYYEVLESSREDSLEIIKKNYRRLIKEYHYDSIASKGLPENMLKFAEEKTKELNEAYDVVKKEKSKG